MFSAQCRRVAAALCLFATLSTPLTAWAQTKSLAELSALLECKADVATYLKFRRWISRGGPDVVRSGFAWRRTNLFQAEYALSHSVGLFGMTTRVLGLTANGVLAEVDGATPQRLAQQLGVDPLVNTDTMFVANKLIAANDAAKAHAGETQVAPTDLDLDALLDSKPAKPAYDAQEVVRVITNLGRPGRTMVGCNYISSAESPNLPFPTR